ncbi:MAG: BrnA antitoxin family protein [Terriglobales bacterium]
MKKKRKLAKKRGQKQAKIARLWASAEGPGSQTETEPAWRRYYKAPKKQVTLRLDADVLAWFKKQGPRYQTKINRVLRWAMKEEIDVSL